MRGILQENIRTDRVKKGFNCSIKTLIDFNDKDIIEFLFEPKSEIFNFIDNEFKKLFNEDLTKNHFKIYICFFKH